MFYSKNFRIRSPGVVRIAEPQPWYRRGRRFAKRLWSFSRPAVTTDPYIADIRRHVFGNSDCTPQACNTVKDADGNVVLHGCGKPLPAEEFRQHWHACPACHRPDLLDPSTYVDLVLDPDSFREIYTNLMLEHIDGWTELYDYTAMRQKSARQLAGNEALVIGHGRMFEDIPVALAVSNFAYMGGSMGAVVGEKFRAIVHFALAHHLPLLAITTTGAITDASNRACGAGTNGKNHCGGRRPTPRWLTLYRGARPSDGGWRSREFCYPR